MLQPAPNSPDWWLQTLNTALDKRAVDVARNQAYYAGNHPLPTPPKGLSQEAQKQASDAFRSMTRLGVTNWVKLVADAPVERLEIVGFRAGDAPDASAAMWKTWQANELDADSGLVHEAAVQTGQAFVLVWPDGKGGVDITPETPSQCIVAYVAGSRRKRAAALKRWDDGNNMSYATLYLPDGLYKFQAKGSAVGTTWGQIRWEHREVAGESWPLANPFGDVPMVEFRANATLEPAQFGGGLSEFDGVITVQDRINKTIFDRLVTAEYQAFRQRYAIGWEPPTIIAADGTDTGQPDRARMAQVSSSRLMAFPEGVQVGEFGQANFSDFIDAVEADIAAMAAISKTPPDYLLGKMVNVSGPGLAEAKASLIGKVRRHARAFGERWEEVLRLASMVTDDLGGADVESTVLWADMESRTLAESVDAAVKIASLGVPEEEVWARIPGVTPQDIRRWKAMRAADGLFGAALATAPSLEPLAAPQTSVPVPPGGHAPAPVGR